MDKAKCFFLLLDYSEPWQPPSAVSDLSVSDLTLLTETDSICGGPSPFPSTEIKNKSDFPNAPIAWQLETRAWWRPINAAPAISFQTSVPGCNCCSELGSYARVSPSLSPLSLLLNSNTNCIVPLGLFLWKIRIVFLGESQLRQSRNSQPTMHAGYFYVFIIHRTPTWATRYSTCAQMLMHAIAHGGVRTL